MCLLVYTTLFDLLCYCVTIVINCVRLLTRLLPFLFESDDWRQLFWTPSHMSEVVMVTITVMNPSRPSLQVLLANQTN